MPYQVVQPAMADQSIYKLVANFLEDTIHPLTQLQTTLTNNQQDLSHNIDCILEQLSSLTTSPHASPSPPISITTPSLYQNRAS